MKIISFLLSILALNVTAVVNALEDLYEFPPTKEKDLVHGLCAKGLKSVSATSDWKELTYGLVEDLQDGDPLWADTRYNSAKPFVGEGGFCEGGTYLKPSKHNKILRNTTISIQGSLLPGTDATLCYFVEAIPTHWNRDGGWGQLPDFDFVKEYQWDATRVTDKKHRKKGLLGKSKIYCKTIVNEETMEPLNVASASKMMNGVEMQEGINLISLDGSAEYPPGAVKVVSRDTSTVTVELKQAWGSPVDKYFYKFGTNTFTQKCFEEVAPEPDVLVDTITIQCFVTSPVAALRLCLQDTTGELLDPVDDQGTLTKCCHSDSPLGTPTVCYNLEIDCRDTTRRSLRGNGLRLVSSRKDV